MQRSFGWLLIEAQKELIVLGLGLGSGIVHFVEQDRKDGRTVEWPVGLGLVHGGRVAVMVNSLGLGLGLGWASLRWAVSCQ